MNDIYNSSQSLLVVDHSSYTLKIVTDKRTFVDPKLPIPCNFASKDYDKAWYRQIFPYFNL